MPTNQLLPHQKITKCFDEIKEKANGKLAKFCKYVEKTWMKSSIWPPQAWSTYLEEERTNNDLEGWHTKLNNGKNDAYNLFHLIDVLLREGNKIPMQAKLLSQKQRLRIQKKSTISLESKLVDLWSRYKSQKLSSKALLEQCAVLYYNFNKGKLKTIQEL